MVRKLKWQIAGEPLGARYKWCQGPVSGRGPAVEIHWHRVMFLIYNNAAPNGQATEQHKRIVLVGIIITTLRHTSWQKLNFVIFINKKYTHILKTFIKPMQRSITKTIFLVVTTIKVTSGKASEGNRFLYPATNLPKLYSRASGKSVYF